MILTSFMLMMITTTFTLYLASTPIILGANILVMSLLLASVFAAFMSSWFAFLAFLIYIGGMLVMFAYFMALTPNQQISNFNTLPYMLISMITFSVLTYTANIKIPIISYMNQGNTILYMPNTAPFLILLALILLLTMVIVVKLTSRTKGPLRPFFAP